MERRQFLRVTAVGVTAELLAHPPLSAADSAQGWRPDGVGSIARIGVLTPAFDPVPESEAWAMAPEGVSIHAARVRRQRGETSVPWNCAPNWSLNGGCWNCGCGNCGCAGCW